MSGRNPKEKPVETESTEIVVCFENGDEIRGEDKKAVLKALDLTRKKKALEKQLEQVKVDLKSQYANKGVILIGDDYKMQVVPKESIAIDDHEALLTALGEEDFREAVEVETVYRPTDWLKDKLKHDNSSQIRLASKCLEIKQTHALEFRPVN